MASELSFPPQKIEIVRRERASAQLDPFADPARNERLIVEELKVRRGLGKRARVDGLGALTWLKEVCYQIILAWIADDVSGEALERLEQHGRFVRGTPRPDRNIFEEGVVAILAASPGLLTSRDVEQLAAPMWYGFRHYIPPALLTGFNLQYPWRKGEAGSWRDRIEPALDDWVVERRVAGFGSDFDAFRCKYPPKINKRVAQLQARISEAEDGW